MINLEAPEPFWQLHFWSKVRKTADHWLWNGRILSRKLPYGIICNRAIDERPRLAHHIAWELTHKHHLARNERLINQCGFTTCVRPDHWRLVHTGHISGDDEATRLRNESMVEDRLPPNNLSYQAIADKHGISRQRVEQIVKHILQRQ